MRGRPCGGKFINGRKRTILVDTLGLPWAIKVTAANVSDNQAGILATNLLQNKVPRLKKITADMGYKNTFIEHITTNYEWEVEIAQNRTADAARIIEGVCSSKKSLAGRKELWLVKF